MASPAVRYDPIADWYVDFTRGWDAEPVALLPGELRGERVLDLACGYGSISRYLAERGAVVTAVDLSMNLLAHARERESTTRLGIRFLHGDATGTEWWDGEPFDGVLCHMALMDIDDLDAALLTVAAVLKPGGWFSFSVFHPCFPGGPVGSGSGLSSWPPDAGYSSEGWWTTNGDGVRGHAGSHHRMLSTYLNAVVRAGLEFAEFAEPRAALPLYLIARCRKPE